MNKAFLYGLVIVAAATTAGCGQKELSAKKTYPVQGKVQIKGEPVAFALVTFEPKGGKGASATGYTDKEGNLVSVRTYSNSEDDGMAPGEYDVKIEGYNPITAVKYMGPKPTADDKPTEVPLEVANSSVTVAVESNDSNQLNIAF